jgi:hypothetical protein
MTDEKQEEHGEKSLQAREPTTQTEIRQVAFASAVLTIMNVAEAYRDVFDPGAPITPAHHISGSRMLKDRYVGSWIRSLATHSLEEAGVDRTLAVRRLLQTIESDITDYVRVEKDDDGHIIYDGFMSLSQIREALPPEKRRLIKKYTERLNKDGVVTSRTIEMESKQAAIELLARIQKWVAPGEVNVVQAGMIVNVISSAQATALRKMEALRPAIEGSNTVSGISRSAVAQQKLLPAAPAEPPK